MNELDLHGVRYEDVPHKCHKFINANWGKEMKIITGNSGRLKTIVSMIIKQYDLGYHVGGITTMEGYIRIFRGM